MTSKHLIERLEAATDGGRELDREIAQKLGWGRSGTRGRWVHPETKKLTPLPHFTRSLDAALTLIPGGWEASINTQGHARLFPPDGDDGAGGYDFSDLRHFSRGATPALALCIGLLKARSNG